MFIYFNKLPSPTAGSSKFPLFNKYEDIISLILFGVKISHLLNCNNNTNLIDLNNNKEFVEVD